MTLVLAYAFIVCLFSLLGAVELDYVLLLEYSQSLWILSVATSL